MRLGGYGYLSLQDTRDDETGRRWADACSVSPIQEATVAASPAAGTGRSPRRPLRPPRPPSVVLVHRPVEAEAESEPEGEKAGAGGLGGWGMVGAGPHGEEPPEAGVVPGARTGLRAPGTGTAVGGTSR